MLQTQSHVLVVEPGITKDAEIEKALRVPGVDVRYTSGLDETLSLFLSLLPSVIILDSLTKEADPWRLIARIWAEATKQSHHLAFILLADQTNTWQVDQFGPIRFTDRPHLQEAFRDILTAPHHGSTTERPEESPWETVRNAIWVRGNDRFRAEQDRMRRLGILDERGQPTSKELPADMMPGSKTDVAT